jgi:uncharacterized protein YndB with AHSA1/START domain
MYRTVGGVCGIGTSGRHRGRQGDYDPAVQRELTVTSPAPPERVFDYLAVPRNLLTANHQGPVVERSTDPAEGLGSWVVLAFDQVRVRVGYTAFDRPAHIAVTMDYTGFGSGGRHDTADYRLEPLPDGGTRVTMSGGSNRPAAPLIGRLIGAVMTRRVRSKFAAIT